MSDGLGWLEAVILGLVEGTTEFLPVSSTGHLILARSLLGLQGAAVDAYLVIIQGAAILAVCWEYRARLWRTATSLQSEPASRRFFLHLAVAFMPLAVLGLLFQHEIKAALFGPIPVAIALIVGGVVILWAERREHTQHLQHAEQLRFHHAWKLGLFQALALIPGTSRSGATIIGGLLLGMSRTLAAEFSFFVAIPTLLAATGYELVREGEALSALDPVPLALGAVVSFFSAFAATQILIRFVSRHSFEWFAWYRIAFGLAVLLSWHMGWIAWN
jgi:undecaprenyl-diphosphatase